MFGWPIIKLSTHLMQHYGIEDLIATDYYIMNRKDGFRSIPQKNFDDIVSYFKTNHPGNNYKSFYCNGTVKETAIIWRTAKFVFAPTGSNCVKNVFMKEKSVLVVILGSVTDNSICLSAGSHGVYTLYGIIKGMPHWGYGRNMIDINLATRLFDIGLYCSDHGHWKENETFKSKLETN